MSSCRASWASRPPGVVCTGVVAVTAGSVVTGGAAGSLTTTVPVIPSCTSHMNEYVPAFENVHVPDQLPDFGMLGNVVELAELPPVVCAHASPPCGGVAKWTSCISTDAFEKVTVPPVTMLALVDVPLPAVRMKTLAPSTVLNDAVEGGSSPCAIVAVIAPTAARATSATAILILDFPTPTPSSTQRTARADSLRRIQPPASVAGRFTTLTVTRLGPA